MRDIDKQFLLLLLTICLSSCSLAYGQHELLPPAQAGLLMSKDFDQVRLLLDDGVVELRCVRISRLAAHGNGYATRETLEETLRREGAKIGADFVVSQDFRVTKDESVGIYGGDVMITTQIQRPHLFGTACLFPKASIGLHVDKDWRIKYVWDGSPAQRAGLHEGDTLLTVDGTYLATNQWAWDLLALRAPGDTVTIEVLTVGGKKEKRPLILGPPEPPITDFARMGLRPASDPPRPTP